MSNEEQHQDNIEKLLKTSGNQAFGVLDHGFLMQSIGGLTRNLPLCVKEDESADFVVRLMVEKKVGSVLLTNKEKKISGIFTERDYLKNFALGERDAKNVKVKDVATSDPVTCPPETTIAYALNLMSHGGFRHLPVVDESGFAIGVVSVRDILDKISELMMQDLMSFGS